MFAHDVRLTCRSYAKINLYLDVRDRRDDGFTNIETIFQTVGLFDELQFAPADSGIELTCTDPTLPLTDDNLVHRAAAVLRERTGTNRGAHIHLKKNIPIAAGLAGGSGNAAATLRGLNKLWDTGVDDFALRRLALQLGSDVPYCLHGGTMAATGRGELLAPLPSVPATSVVLVNPGIAISAGAVYSHPKLTRSEEIPVDGRTPAFQSAIDTLAKDGPTGMLFNRMETPVFHEHPEVADICAGLLEHGCSAALMSGSGSTVFGLAEAAPDADAIRAAFPGCFVATTTTVNAGVTFHA